MPLTPANVLGVLSLIFWALIVIVIASSTSLFVMRADNRGEGGILALMALVPQPRERHATRGAICSSRSASSAPRCSTATA